MDELDETIEDDPVTLFVPLGNGATDTFLKFPF